MMQINWAELVIGGLIGWGLAWLADNVLGPRIRQWMGSAKQRQARQHYHEQTTPAPPEAFRMYTLGNIQVPVMNLIGSPETPFTIEDIHVEYRPSMHPQKPSYPDPLRAAKSYLEDTYKGKYEGHVITDNPIPRLMDFQQAGETAEDSRGGLTLTFELTTFCTFLATNRSLDYAVIPRPGLTARTQTIREAFVRFPYRLTESVLANPLSCHMVLISRSRLQDPPDQVIIRQRSNKVALYKEAFQVSASGFLSINHLDNQGNPNPFVTAVVEAREEVSDYLNLSPSDFRLLGIALNWEDLDLNAYGYAETGLTTAEILGGFRRDDFEGTLQSLPFEATTILSHIVNNKWEPVSTVAMCATLLKFFPQQEVLRIARQLPARRRFWDYYEHGSVGFANRKG